MKYKELVSFEPLQSVKVLREAEDIDRARDDVRTFVISSRMAEQLAQVIFPNLQFHQPTDQKGLLAVANYGTGKTHLMSVIAAVAEHEELVADLTNDDVAEAAKPLAGCFKVVRAEIGATTMSLRDIVCRELQDGLAGMGVTFKFPDLSEVTGTKDSLADMMTTFEAKHPSMGLLFVLDELLDYLRGRRDAELIQDLSFLREIGEISRSTRFRFLGGVQEAIFENPRFAGVADAVKRVKDRFEQIRIAREDVAFVVQQRLLRKTVEQRDSIREHLQPFTPLYEGMAERIEDFISLFPVHPAYLRTFELITAVEKRTVLKTLSQEMTKILDADVPSDTPGLICYDTYRVRLDEDPANRQIESVREVLEKADVLRNRVEQALPNPVYVPTALRIIDGLAVHRLTTDDIYVPIGATRKELRDDLCLMPPNLPEQDAFFLETTVDTIIDGIIKAVSGQFISENAENGQVYLDVKKDVDYDQKIDDRATSLDAERLDEAYFKALEEVLERRDSPYMTGYRIWEYELAWGERNVTRFGYLFMGAPNQRSTAQPPRDFYIYFLQPYDRPTFVDEKKPDEVFFQLADPDDGFTAALRRYAGATALAAESTATHRGIYEDKARTALRNMIQWLRSKMGEAVTVTHRGKAQPLVAWLESVRGERGSVKTQVDSIASSALETHFATRYPGYPRFTATVTRDNLGETARAALAQVATGRKTSLGTKALESLELVDVHGQFCATGEFAKALERMVAAGGGKVVNRSDLLTERDPGVYTWAPWHLEPVWLVVVAAALTQLGRMEIGTSGGQVDAIGLDRLAKLDSAELDNFTHLAPPKALPVVQLREIAGILALPQGIVPNHGVDEAAVQQFLTAASSLATKVTDLRAKLRENVQLWGSAVVDQADDRDSRLEGLQKLLENVKARNSVGKLNKLDVGPDVIAAARRGVEELNWVDAALAAAAHLAPTVEFLREAVQVFGEEDPLSEDARNLRGEIVDLFQTDSPVDAKAVAQIRAHGETLRVRFADEASRSYRHHLLDAPGDELKKEILESDMYADLQRLQAVKLLPGGSFGSLVQKLTDIRTCKDLDESRLRDSVIYPGVNFQPRRVTGPSARATLDATSTRIRDLHQEWVRTLRDNLRAPEMAEQIKLLDEGKAAVESLADTGDLPSPVTDGFVHALNQVFDRFDVHRITATEMWQALFPDSAPTTPEELRDRFLRYLAGLGEIDSDRIRIIPTVDNSSDQGEPE